MSSSKWLMYFFLILILGGCSTGRIDQEISKIDGLISRAEGLREKLGTDEINGWHEIYYEIEDNTRLIDSGLVAGWDNPMLKSTIKAYREVYFILGGCINSCMDLQKEISYIEGHLRVMKDGRLNETLSDSAYQVQFRNEMDLLDELTERIYTGLSTVEEQVENYRKYNPVITKYTAGLKSGNAGKSDR